MLRREDNFQGRVRRMFYRLAHGMLLYDHRAKNLLIDYGFAPEKLYVVYNSLNYAEQKKQREAVAASAVTKFKQDNFSNPDLPQLIYLGRYTEGKQPELMVRVAQILRERGNEVNVLMIGKGPHEALCRDLVNELHLASHVCMFGPCYQEDKLAPLMAGSDVAIIPGLVGLSAMHFMAYGLPVLTCDDRDHQKPEVEAILAGSTGDFFPHGNAKALADLVEQWIAKDKTEVRAACINKIETLYNPESQNAIINYAVQGFDAREQPAADYQNLSHPESNDPELR